MYSGGVFGKVVKNMSDSKESIASTRAMWLIPIASIFERYAAPPKIDFMSLDVEGHEQDIMKAFPFARHNVSVLLVERPSNGLVRILEHHDYIRLCSTKLGDTFFAHWPLDDLAEWATQGTDGCASDKSKCSQKLLPACNHLIFHHAPVCASAHELHTKTTYWITGHLEHSFA